MSRRNRFAVLGLMCVLGPTLVPSAGLLGEEPSAETSSNTALRTWTDRTGKFTTRASFVDLKSGAVRLKKEDGTIISVSLKVLCDADQKFIASATTSNDAESTPTDNAAHDGDFSKLGIRIAVPKGWRIVEQEVQDGHGHCILQPDQGDPKAAIAIWIGEKYIKQAPSSGNINAGNVLAAATWANQKVMSIALGTPNRRPPRTTEVGGSFKGMTIGKHTYIASESANTEIAGLGLSDDTSNKTPITLGCASHPAEFEATKKLLNYVIVNLEP